MTIHAPHPDPDERPEFLVDGCPRCAEYVSGLGVPFSEERFRAFWAKMVEVEFDDVGAWLSKADKELGRQMYHLALALQRAYSLDVAKMRGGGVLLFVPLDLPRRVQP